MSSRLVEKKGTTFSTEAYTYDDMNRIKEVNGGGSADFFDFYWDGELMSATYGGGPHTPYTEGQEPDLDTTDNIDPNAGYQPPDTEGPEPTPPPDDSSDPPVGGLLPPDLPTGHSVGYYFDKAGNRQQVTDTANPTINFVINPINEYNSASGCSITNGLEHEISSFQVLYDTQLVNYHYLNDEHLISVSGGGSNRYFYYDALGRCVMRVGSGATTYYICDGDKPIVEYTSSTVIVGRNVYGKGIDEILMRTDPGVNGGNPIYYAQDHEGSVTHLLDGRSNPATQTGNVIEQYHYDAFGLPTFYDANTKQINSTAYNNRFLFTGREYAATYRGTYSQVFRFYEYRARAYHPDLGRFMSEDPKLFDAGDYNLFRYCHNDPIDFTDPMGLQDTVATYNPRETSQFKADEEYGRAMGQAQWNMRWSTQGAIGMGTAGYNAWSALQRTVGITGQVIGGRVDYSRAPVGDANDRDAPSKAEIIGSKDYDDYKLYRLQVETKTGSPIRGTVYSKENVQLDTTKTKANFVPQLSTTNRDFIAGAKGVITDRVGLLYRPSATATGDVYTRQTYQIGYGGFRYNIAPTLQQHVQITNGRFIGADLTTIGP